LKESHEMDNSETSSKSVASVKAARTRAARKAQEYAEWRSGRYTIHTDEGNVEYLVYDPETPLEEVIREVHGARQNTVEGTGYVDIAVWKGTELRAVITTRRKGDGDLSPLTDVVQFGGDGYEMRHWYLPTFDETPSLGGDVEGDLGQETTS